MLCETDWDKPLPDDKLDEWKFWRDSLSDLTALTIPRSYFPVAIDTIQTKHLYIYSDASEKAISAAAYIIGQSKDNSLVKNFVMGKAKVAPKNGHTIPRSELCAAVLAVDIHNTIVEHIDIRFDKVLFFTDSKVVLGYINNTTRRFYNYVSNRVEKILRSTSVGQWKYVNTNRNPADFATRPVKVKDMVGSTWVQGPDKLFAEDESSDYPLIEPDKEIRQIVDVRTTDVKDSLGSKRFERFSSWSRLIIAICCLIRLCRSVKRLEPGLNQPEIDQIAERILLKSVQQDHFPQELSKLRAGSMVDPSSHIVKLNPILDKDGLLRVGGRLRQASIPLSEKNPIIIPKTCHLATLLVRHYHNQVCHQGRFVTEGALRAGGFWIIGCKRLVSSVIHKCVRCRKLRGKMEVQIMADLPSDRLEPGPPFVNVGVDVFGPWEVLARKTRGGQANSKRWGILFTCLTTRAVHIELVDSLSASAFINALRRFIALRGDVRIFRSDQGTNFVGSVRELGINSVNVESDEVKGFLRGKGAIRIFNPPHASHMGGVWERMIGLTRNILNSILMDAKYLTHEVLSTALAEVCAIINARPLVPISSDPECPEILTPSMLVTQKCGPVTCDLQMPERVDPSVQWKYVQSLADKFWKRWRNEYIQTLQVRRKWAYANTNVKIGDVVLLKDKEVSRNEWPLGLIVKVYSSDDEKVRKVDVKISRQGQSVIRVRPVSELVVLISDK